MHSSEQIKDFILENLSRHQKDIIKASIHKFGISRQAILKHMHTLINKDRVIAHGKTRDRFYELKPIVNYSKSVDIDESISANDILRNQILPNLDSIPSNIHEICEFSFQALLSNVFDHAQASILHYKIYVSPSEIHFILNDNGIGIFKKLNRFLGLNDFQVAAIEIAKGRITTDPVNHAGDELMTVIRLFDQVTIDASGICLTYQQNNNEWTISESSQQNGTRIHLEISTNSNRTCEKVFYQIFQQNDSSVCIPVNLVRSQGGQVNSRTQAQSLLHNLKDLNEIEFDFNNIDLIGPAFADELIRKTKVNNKNSDITWINSTTMVDMLMSRAINRLN